MAILNLNKRNSDVSVLVQVGAECLDLTFPVHKHLALRLLRAQGPPPMLRAQGPPSTVHSAALHERSGTGFACSVLRALRGKKNLPRPPRPPR